MEMNCGDFANELLCTNNIEKSANILKLGKEDALEMPLADFHSDNDFKNNDDDNESDDALASHRTLKKSLRKCKRIFDSDESDNNSNEATATTNEMALQLTAVRPPKANLTTEEIATLVNADDEVAGLANSDAKENASSDESAMENALIIKRKNRRKVFISKDSEKPVDSATKSATVEKHTKVSALIDTDTESELEESVTNKKVRCKKPTQSQNKNKNKKVLTNLNFANNNDASTTATDADLSAADDEHEKHGKGKKERSVSKAKPAKPIRKSAKKALDEMKAIQSEQQRLHRDACISVPYHVSRRHTLREFFNRRAAIASKEESPLAAAIRNKRTRMTDDELAEMARLIEERAKEALEFFRSESESQSEPEPEPEEEKEKEQISEANKEEQAIGNNECVEPATAPTETAVETDLTANVFAQADEMAARLQEEKTAAKVLVTEVLELPNLDISKLHVSVDAEVSTATATAETVSAAPVTTTKLNDSIQRIIAEKNITDSPTIQGCADMDIDLESGNFVAKTPSAADDLLQRMLATNRTGIAKDTTIMNIVSVDNGELNISKIKVNMQKELSSCSRKSHKPGEAYKKLKDNLCMIIRQKRIALRLKRMKENAEAASKEIADDEHDATDSDDCNMDEVEGNENSEHDEEYSESDAAAINSNYEQQIDDNTSSDSADDGDDELDSPSKSRKRIIRAFENNSDLDDDADSNGFCAPFPPQVPFTIPNGETESIIMTLDSQPTANEMTQSDGMSSLMALCSGTFGSQSDTQTTLNCSSIKTVESIAGQTQLSSIAFDEELTQLSMQRRMEDNCQEATNATLSVAENNLISTSCKNLHSDALEEFSAIISTDDEDGNGHSKANFKSSQRRKCLAKKIKKGQVKLGFSDDENDKDETNSVDDANDDDDNDAGMTIKDMCETSDANDDEARMPETFIDYDSDENEVIVQMTKKERIKRAGNYFELEAELSESDWGSADENEKDMDEYDIELGDEDVFDKEQLRAELGKIHAQKMLDKDIREVRKLQEIYIEDEEHNDIMRQRQFKWKNAESGFSLDYRNNNDNDDGNGNENSEEEDNDAEKLWRKIRFEREKVLKEQQSNENSSQNNGALPSAGSNKKIMVISGKTLSKTHNEVKKGSPFLILNEMATLHRKTARASFLVRDNATLQKLAGFAEGCLSEEQVTAGTAAHAVNAIQQSKTNINGIRIEQPKCSKRRTEDASIETYANLANCPKKLRASADSNERSIR